jgi:hypothetical protein
MKPLLIFPLILLFGCVTTPQQHTKLPTSREFNAPMDAVWPLLVNEIASQYQIKVIEKQSGLLTTDFISMPAGFNNANSQQWVYQPSVFLSTWNGLRMNLSAVATQPQTNKTVISLTAHFEAFEDNIYKQWLVCDTRGSLESGILDAINAKLDVSHVH